MNVLGLNVLGRGRGLRNRSFSTWNLIDQSLKFVGGSLVTEETRNDADGFFRSRTIYADIGDQTCDQFVHYSLASPEKVRRARDILQGQRRG